MITLGSCLSFKTRMITDTLTNYDNYMITLDTVTNNKNSRLRLQLPVVHDIDHNALASITTNPKIRTATASITEREPVTVSHIDT